MEIGPYKRKQYGTALLASAGAMDTEIKAIISKVILIACFLMAILSCTDKGASQADFEFQRTDMLRKLEDEIRGKEPSIEVARANILLGKSEAGIAMLENLIAEGSDSAYFALARMRNDGHLIEEKGEFSEHAFSKLCESYIEPCVFLAQQYIARGEFEKAESAYLSSAKLDYIVAISGLYELYAKEGWSGHSLEKSKYWAAKIGPAKEYRVDSLGGLTRRQP